jgi:hypothetical protein
MVDGGGEGFLTEFTELSELGRRGQGYRAFDFIFIVAVVRSSSISIKAVTMG